MAGRTTAIQPRQRGASMDRLTPMMRMFCLEMLADKDANATQCAVRAGYSKKTAGAAANRMLKDKRVRAILGKFQREREDRTQVTADDVWKYLDRVMRFDPLTVFQSTKGGWWYIRRLEDIPEEYRELIEEVDLGESKNGNQTVRVKLVSKTSALALAARHTIAPMPQQHQVAVAQVNLEPLVRTAPAVNPIEARLSDEG